MTDTIYALASAPGRAGIAVMRVSGPKAWDSARALTRKHHLKPRQAELCHLRDPHTSETIDRGLLLAFKGPASYTGEDIVEYHLHGGRAVVEAFIAALARQPGHRLAEPGEFTRRAFENGKMDLTAAEAVADLIDAETQAQKQQALSQIEGALSHIYTDWSERLKGHLAYAEAEIEFPDEDLPSDIVSELRPRLEAICAEIAAHLNDNRRGERLREGIHIAVIGAPNAGKSSLVNALARRDVAIVSDLAGTTRDVIEAHLDLGGYPVILADTAGLRPEQTGADGHDAIEAEGMRRAVRRAEDADIKLLIFDGSADLPDAYTLGLIDDKALLVINKIDRGPARFNLPAAVNLSVLTGAGIDQLLKALQTRIAGIMGEGRGPALTRQRHRAALEDCRDALMRACAAPLPELMAEDMRLAVRALGRITGRVDVEDLLDVIFRDFCIGK